MTDDSTPLSKQRSIRSGARTHGADADRTPLQRHPVVLRLNAERAEDLQLRLADQITSFAGSMPFVYLHAIAIGVWMLFIESSPWPKLTLAVSLEAIFLSAFLMIGQNRQAAFQQAKADHDFRVQEHELHANTRLTREIHVLASGLYEQVLGADPSRMAQSHGTRRGNSGRRRAHRTRQTLRGASSPRAKLVGARLDQPNRR